MVQTNISKKNKKAPSTYLQDMSCVSSITFPSPKKNIAPEEHGCLGNCPFLFEISAHFEGEKPLDLRWRNRPLRPEKNV